METLELRNNILNGKTAELKKAVKFVVKNNIKAFGEDIYKAFVKIKHKPNKWALQIELIKSLSSLEYKGAVADFKNIIEEDIPYDMVTLAASTAFVQLTRKNISDLTGVINLLDKGISVVSGALQSLAMEPSTPDLDSINIILSRTKNINKHPQRLGKEFGLIDPRLYVAIATHYWESDQKENYLQHCMQTAYNTDRFGKEIPNTQLKLVCENSLNGKPSKGFV